MVLRSPRLRQKTRNEEWSMRVGSASRVRESFFTELCGSKIEVVAAPHGNIAPTLPRPCCPTRSRA